MKCLKNSMRVFLLTLMLMFSGAVLTTTIGCDDNSAEKAGEKIDKGVDNAKDAAKDAGDKVGDAVDNAKDEMK